jgi:hypothetical protein
VEAAFEELRNKHPSGTPLTSAQEEERDWFIERKNDIFQQRLDRAEWEGFVERQMIEPLHTSKTSSIMINKMPMGRILGEDGIEQVLQEALEKNYVDEFTATKIKNGEIINPQTQEPDGPV